MSREIFPKPAIKDLSLKAGVAVLDGQAYDPIRDKIGTLIVRVSEAAYLRAQTSGRTTVNLDDVLAAIKDTGYVFSHAPKQKVKRCVPLAKRKARA
jgi:histone H3/H4